MEEKVDHLTKMTDEVTKRQLEREDTALQYNRYTFLLIHRHDHASTAGSCYRCVIHIVFGVV